MRNRRTVLLLLSGLFVFSFLAGRVTTSGAGSVTAPKIISASQEWDEVRKRYPRFAVEYLKTREALSEGVQFARATNLRAFNTSAFRTALEGLCDRTDGVRPLFCNLLESGGSPPARTRCPNCTNVCSTGQSPVDCSDCLQKKADAGCL